MKKENWVWMPHPGHFICSRDCKFFLNTYVGGYIVSTVGEMWPVRQVREIHAQVRDLKWLSENKHLLGDSFDAAYMKKFGFYEIGMNRTYETMVFKAKKSKHKCCPFEMVSGADFDMNGYKKPEDAYAGHLDLCAHWSKKR